MQLRHTQATCTLGKRTDQVIKIDNKAGIVNLYRNDEPIMNFASNDELLDFEKLIKFARLGIQ